MADETPENDAVREAEDVLGAAVAKLQSGEDCVEGDACPIHHRNDIEELEEEEEFGRIISYVGEYCVMTGDNPELESPAVLLCLILGLYSKEQTPHKFETAIMHVGDGALWDLYDLPVEEHASKVRYLKKYSGWDDLKVQHEAALMGLREGLLDVSKPVMGE